VTPAILTAAICGAETTRAQTPYLPITADELAEEAAACASAGASVIHLHVRKDDGTPTQDRALFDKAIRAIRARCDVIVQTSTGGAVGMSAEERAQPLECAPDMASLNAGSLNFGDEVFANPFPLVREFARRMREKRIVPELECYDAGHVDSCLLLAQEGAIDLPAHFDFVLGVPGGMAASEQNLRFLISKLPEGCTFSVAGIGRHQLPMAELSLRAGGQHLPVEGRAGEGQLRAGGAGRQPGARRGPPRGLGGRGPQAASTSATELSPGRAPD
jgi:3-keto-5-aminohexanoate cleavage enzyme